MFSFNKNRKEEESVHTLLRLSQSEDEKQRSRTRQNIGSHFPDKFDKKRNNFTSESHFELEPWLPYSNTTNSFMCTGLPTENRARESTQAFKPTSSTSTTIVNKPSNIRFIRCNVKSHSKLDNKASKKLQLNDEALQFYHFNNTNDYMKQYRENVTSTTIQHYRKENTIDFSTICEKCERNCHCLALNRNYSNNLPSVSSPSISYSNGHHSTTMPKLSLSVDSFNQCHNIEDQFIIGKSKQGNLANRNTSDSQLKTCRRMKYFKKMTSALNNKRKNDRIPKVIETKNQKNYLLI